MSKINELSMILDEMKNCGETMIQIAEDLKRLFAAETAEQPPKEPKEKTPAKQDTLTKTGKTHKTIKKEEIRAILAEKSRDGYTMGIKNLMKKYGANKLSELKENDYEAFLQEVEVLNHD